MLVHRELHEDRWRCFLQILYLSLGQRSLGACAPENRLLTAINKTLLNDASEGSDDCRLIGGFKCQIGMLPIAKDTKSAELGSLNINELPGILFRFLTHLKRSQSRRGLHHTELDRQTMAIPSRNERSLKSCHRLRFDDQILENLVQGSPHMDIPICKRWTIMKYILRRSIASLLDGLVKPLLLPFSQKLRFTLSQTSLHGKVGLGKANGIFVTGHGN